MKSKLDYAEIYITNVCNYSCAHCQSLNNFAFKGHQLWRDYQGAYQSLSDHIDIDTVQIMGGEPTLNPDFENWISGISELWPNSRLEITTNGSRLDRINHDVYAVLSKHRGTLWITCHDIKLYDDMLRFAKTFLDEVISNHDPDKKGLRPWRDFYRSIRREGWPRCDGIDQWINLPEQIKQEFVQSLHSGTVSAPTVSRILCDKNGVQVRLDWTQSFVPSMLEVVDLQRLKTKYHSDPTRAHDVCGFRTCHQINKGKLYKCPLVSVLPDFLDQFDVDMSDHDRLLARSYQPVTGDDSDDEIRAFVANISQPIPQCKFCPADYNKMHNFVGTAKKIKILSRQ